MHLYQVHNIHPLAVQVKYNDFPANGPCEAFTSCDIFLAPDDKVTIYLPHLARIPAFNDCAPVLVP